MGSTKVIVESVQKKIHHQDCAFYSWEFSWRSKSTKGENQREASMIFFSILNLRLYCMMNNDVS